MKLEGSFRLLSLAALALVGLACVQNRPATETSSALAAVVDDGVMEQADIQLEVDAVREVEQMNASRSEPFILQHIPN